LLPSLRPFTFNSARLPLLRHCSSTVSGAFDAVGVGFLSVIRQRLLALAVPTFRCRLTLKTPPVAAHHRTLAGTTTQTCLPLPNHATTSQCFNWGLTAVGATSSLSPSRGSSNHRCLQCGLSSAVLPPQRHCLVTTLLDEPVPLLFSFVLVLSSSRVSRFTSLSLRPPQHRRSFSRSTPHCDWTSTLLWASHSRRSVPCYSFFLSPHLSIKLRKLGLHSPHLNNYRVYSRVRRATTLRFVLFSPRTSAVQFSHNLTIFFRRSLLNHSKDLTPTTRHGSYTFLVNNT